MNHQSITSQFSTISGINKNALHIFLMSVKAKDLLNWAYLHISCSSLQSMKNLFINSSVQLCIYKLSVNGLYCIYLFIFWWVGMGTVFLHYVLYFYGLNRLSFFSDISQEETSIESLEHPLMTSFKDWGPMYKLPNYRLWYQQKMRHKVKFMSF